MPPTKVGGLRLDDILKCIHTAGLEALLSDHFIKSQSL